MEYQINSKTNTKRTARNVAISAAVLLLTFIAAGVIYVYLTGGETKPAPKTPTKTKADIPDQFKPTNPAANAREGVAVQTLVSPVKAGDNTSISIRALPNSTCKIEVTYNNVPSRDSGLKPQVTDEYGFVSWSWTVEPSVPAGTWPVKVTCTRNDGNKTTGVVIGDLVVTK